MNQAMLVGLLLLLRPLAALAGSAWSERLAVAVRIAWSPSGPWTPPSPFSAAPESARSPPLCA